jgi:uncharacterized protein YkwD
VPIPPNRRTRYILTVIGALGLIGAGSATIIAGTGSEEQQISLASTTPDTAGAQDVAAADTADTGEASPTASAGASPSAATSASASASVSASVSASPSASAATSKPASSTAKRRSKAPTASPTKTTQAPSGGSSTVAAEILRLVNAERSKAGCSALSSESHLDAAAQKHTDLQAEKNSMSHQLPGEASMGDRVTAAGYKWRGLGENVAAGYTSAASVMDGWMNSPGHKANILNCGFEELGVGRAKSSSGTLYWTQVFATPA